MQKIANIAIILLVAACAVMSVMMWRMAHPGREQNRGNTAVQVTVTNSPSPRPGPSGPTAVARNCVADMSQLKLNFPQE